MGVDESSIKQAVPEGFGLGGGVRLVLTTKGTKFVEQSLFRRVDSFDVMQRAGERVAAHAAESLGKCGKALVMAGPGNNGGDGFVAAAELSGKGHRTDVAFCGGELPVSGDAAKAVSAWRNGGGKIHDELPDLDSYNLVIDALFGIGLSKPLTGDALEWVEHCNAVPVPTLAIDVPSGLHAETGRILGAAMRADATVTFFAHKPGLLMADGPDCAGRTIIEPLGIEEEDLPSGSEMGRLVEVVGNRERYRRGSGSNKATHGTVEVVGGSTGMVGALALAARAAVALGAGKTRAVALHKPCPAYDPPCPEAMWSGELGEKPDCRAIGPGLGTSPEAAALLLASTESYDGPLVIDADGLNLLAKDSSLAERLRIRQGALVLTPHPGEAGRLLGCGTQEIQNDRIGSALGIAAYYGAVVALKGAGTVCAAPDGRWWINRSGNAGLATGGSGDVLTGMVASLAAQTGDALQAILDAVWLHGRAAERLAKQTGGLRGVAVGALAAAAAVELDGA